MADIEQAGLTDPQVHEPKDISTATADTVYVADGFGVTGEWTKLTAEQLDTSGGLVGDVFSADGAGGGTWVSSGGANFGSAYFTANTTPTVVGALGTYVTLDPGTWATTVTDSIPFDTNKFTIPEDGIYELSMCVSFAGAGGGAGDIYKMAFAVGGVAITASPKMRRQTGSTDIGSGSRSTYQSLSEGEEITILVQNETANRDPTFSEGSFTIVLLKAL